MQNKKYIVFIVGPTAVGKSDTAIELAQRQNAEIICCDSMQVYKEISIASNKPGEKELREAAHHLFDVASVQETFDVVRYCQLANKALKDILKRDKLPLVVGGSGMYVQILLDGIFSAKGHDEGVRDKLKKEARELGSEALHQRLAAVDPVSAKRIHQRDERRIVRALEVFQATQTPISQLQKQRQGLWGEHDVKIFGLHMDREKLYERINLRVDKMVEEGLLEEARTLSTRPLSLTAQHLIGVKEMLEHIQGGLDFQAAVEKIKQNTRHFAKRQITWFKKDSRVQWIDVNNKDFRQAAGEISNKIKQDG